MPLFSYILCSCMPFLPVEIIKALQSVNMLLFSIYEKSASDGNLFPTLDILMFFILIIMKHRRLGTSLIYLALAWTWKFTRRSQLSPRRRLRLTLLCLLFTISRCLGWLPCICVWFCFTRMPKLCLDVS